MNEQPNKQTRILIADDDPDVLSALRYFLRIEGFEVTAVGTTGEVLSAVKGNEFALAILDLNYSKDTTSGLEGIELIERLGKLDSRLSIIAMTGWGSIETAVKAMQAGARDFIQKPWENERLLSIIANQLLLARAEHKALKLTAENQLLRVQAEAVPQGLVSHSPLMQSMFKQLQQAAASDASILLTGENGTGKSFLVDHIHANSGRSDQPLIKVNMGSITETLFESEMFGHVKGAFTDARENRIGRFELAEDGTLFLDEIANMPYSQQSKLLRVLEERQFEKVGASRTQVANCRLICATNSDLERAVQTGAFRKDLLYRINTIEIHVPSLRQRQEDILPLAESFLAQLARKYAKPDLQMSKEARRSLQDYDWPGNVRELANTLERATVLCEGVIRPELLGLGLASNSQAGETDWQQATLEEIEKQLIEQRIHALQGNNRDAARSLGLSKSAFYRHLKKHGLK